MEMKAKNIFLVVIYNKDLISSETLSSLMRLKSVLKEVDICIWDNSSNPTVNQQEIKNAFKDVNNVFYYASGENVSLSRIYNYVINHYLINYKYLTIFDHDTYVTYEFLSELLITTKKLKHDLILPKIVSNGRLVSPARLYYFLGSYYDKIDTNLKIDKYLTAINSGMTIRSEYFFKTGFQYDENLRFYGTDDYFMKRYCENLNPVYILNSLLTHQLNYYTDEELEKKVWRFREIIDGLIYNNSTNFFLKFMAFTYSVVKSIREAIKHRSWKFLFFTWKR